ncbi:SgcJ/EcaC family oxidoreductase [Nocardia gipuzkoensis]
MTIERIIGELTGAWNARDSVAWARQFTEDAEFVDVMARWQRGRARIEQCHRQIFDTIYRSSRLEMWELDRRPLAEDTTLVHTATALLVADGPRAGRTECVQTMIVRGDRILAFHNTIRDDWGL